jgi:methylthioribose-1-phosphate isomerase
MTLEAIVYKNGKLKLLDQLRLPHETIFIDINTQKDGFDAIRNMNVRGAPAIAITAILTICSTL